MIAEITLGQADNRFELFLISQKFVFSIQRIGVFATFWLFQGQLSTEKPLIPGLETLINTYARTAIPHTYLWR